MAYLNDYEYDIFISYSHVDNETLSTKEAKWVDQFHRALEVRLNQVLGKKVAIWRDIDQGGATYFDKETMDLLGRVALLIPIITPSYITSDWCKRELDAFCRAFMQRGGLTLNNRARIFKVMKTPVDFNNHPEPIKALLGYNFCHTDPGDKSVVEYTLEAHEGVVKKYKTVLNDLVYDIKEFFELIHAQSEGEDEAEERPRVYLAQSTDDRAEDYDSLLRELQDHEYEIVPLEQLRVLKYNELRAEVERALRTCSLAVHLIGDYHYPIPAGAPEAESLVRIQNDVAAMICKEAGLPRIVWIPEHIKGADERQKAFIEALLTDPDVQQGADVVQDPLEKLKEHILDKLRRQRTALQANGVPEEQTVYVVCTEEDYDATVDVEKQLFDAGFNVRLPLTSGSEAQVKDEHDASIQESSAVLIYCGSASEAWVRGQLRALNGLGKPVGLYHGPPEVKFKLRRGWQGVTVMQHFGAFKPSVLDPFLQKLAAAG